MIKLDKDALVLATAACREETFAALTMDECGDVARKVVTTYLTELADTQPANPAQVTDAMVDAGHNGLEEWRRLYVNKDEVRAILTAAIGAGGQAVALRVRNDEAGFVEFVNEDVPYFVREIEGKVAILFDVEKRNIIGYRVYDPSTTFSALSQPHPADERVVEALRIAEERLSSLLARIHRDGGHYEAAHGTEKAWTDADEIIARIYADRDERDLAFDRLEAHSAGDAKEGRQMVERKIYVEFYDRLTGYLEHNGIYSSLDAAFADAHGRVLIVTKVEGRKNG